MPVWNPPVLLYLLATRGLKPLLSEMQPLKNLSSGISPAYERLQAYGFGVDYPNNCVIEFNPKSNRTQGDIALKSPNGYKLFLSWGDLDKVEKLHGVEGHADYSIKRMKGSREATVKDVRREATKVNGHAASFSDIKLEIVRRGLFFNKTTRPQEVRSLHVHCDNSSRYFVLYGPAPPEKSQEQTEVFAKMIQSFACH